MLIGSGFSVGEIHLKSIYFFIKSPYVLSTLGVINVPATLVYSFIVSPVLAMVKHTF
jgi:hypothetical protein